MENIPTEKDWGDYISDMDSSYAHEMFFAKTNKEMQDSFRENVLGRVENLRWMPEKPFQYYMLGLRDYVMSGNFGFHDKADASSCYLELIIQKLEEQPDHIKPILSDLLEAAEYVGNNQKEYDADEDIYGIFKEKLNIIKKFSR